MTTPTARSVSRCLAIFSLAAMETSTPVATPTW